MIITKNKATGTMPITNPIVSLPVFRKPKGPDPPPPDVSSWSTISVLVARVAVASTSGVAEEASEVEEIVVGAGSGRVMSADSSKVRQVK
jgi:hypothetical protein